MSFIAMLQDEGVAERGHAATLDPQPRWRMGYYVSIFLARLYNIKKSSSFYYSTEIESSFEIYQSSGIYFHQNPAG
jgi:hypothetical protein